MTNHTEPIDRNTHTRDEFVPFESSITKILAILAIVSNFFLIITDNRHFITASIVFLFMAVCVEGWRRYNYSNS